MASVLGFVSRNYTTLFPPQPPKEANALKFGILGAALIAPVALVNPAKSHPGVVVYAVAARDPARARAFAKRHGIPTVHNTYQELIDDPAVDVVYNPLPNAFHYEWTMKALKAGKHVLLEKPASDTAQEVVNMFALAREKNLVLLEAFHVRFHPAIQTVKSIVDSGAIGKVKGIEAEMAGPAGLIRPGDIRRNYAVGGGSVMHYGGYTINSTRYILGTEPTSVLQISVNTFPEDALVDRSVRAVLAFPNDVTAAMYTDFAMPPGLGFIPRLPFFTILVDGEEGSVYLSNFAAPSFHHTITVKSAGQEKVVKAYTLEHVDKDAKGEPWWSTYRWMLEAFVDKVQGRTPHMWITEEDSIANMRVIEDIYEKSGLGVRPASSYVHEP